LGDKGSGLRNRGTVQDFNKIRDDCLARGVLFEDPEFPCTDSSIFFSRRPPKSFEWLRPSVISIIINFTYCFMHAFKFFQEITDNPRLFVEGYSRFDIQQGELGKFAEFE
jgi:calpain, invertebrate